MLEIIPQRGESLTPTGVCPECEGPIFPSFRTGFGRATKGVITPKGRYKSIMEAAIAHDILPATAASRVRNKSLGWRHTRETHKCEKVSPGAPKKFCSDKCRLTCRDRNRDERIAFALRLLKFMEKNFPEQTTRMWQGFKTKT